MGVALSSGDQTHKRAIMPFGGCKSAFGISSTEWGNVDSALSFRCEATYYGAAVLTTIKAVDR
jgi:hypothetical protein